jgi:hypothetical protein
MLSVPAKGLIYTFTLPISLVKNIILSLYKFLIIIGLSLIESESIHNIVGLAIEIFHDNESSLVD